MRDLLDPPLGRLRLTWYAAVQVASFVPLDRAVRVLGRRRCADGRLGRRAVPRGRDPGHPVAGQRPPADGGRRARARRCPRRTRRWRGARRLQKLRTVATDPMTWRDLGWMLMAMTIGFVISLVVVVLLLAIATWWIWYYAVGPLMRLRATLDQWLLSPGVTERLRAPGRAADRDPRRRRRPLGRRAAPARARPARRRAGPAGGAVAEPRHGRLDLREGPGRPRASSSATPARRPTPRSASCARWCAASIRRCSPTAA